MRMEEPLSWKENQEKRVSTQDPEGRVSMSDVCSKPHLRRLLFTNTILASILQLTGINAVMYYGPEILSKSGLAEYANGVNIGVGAWNFATTLVAIFLVDRLGRRPLMLIGVTLISFSLIAIGLVSQFVTASTPKSVGVIIGLAGFILGFEVGPGCLFWVIINELFPEAYIEFGGTYANILQWGFNLLVSTVFPILGKADVLGQSGTFYLFGGIGFLCLLYIAIWLPETKATEEDSLLVD